jgi:hypothetical protein
MLGQSERSSDLLLAFQTLQTVNIRSDQRTGNRQLFDAWFALAVLSIPAHAIP